MVRRRNPWDPGAWCRPAVLSIAMLLGMTAGGCDRSAPEDRLPLGDLVVGRAAGIRAWIDPLRSLQESRAAAAARRLSADIAGCEQVEGSCDAEEGCRLWEVVGCRQVGSDGLEGAWELLGEWDWLVSRELERGRWLLRGRRRADGVLEAELDLPALEEAGLRSLMMPAADGPGPARLGGDELLVHLRVRPAGGLEIASLTRAEDLGARLFQLQSDLFLSAVLAGTWELAVEAPVSGARFPATSLALDFRRRGPAVAAMEQLLENLTGVWPVKREPYRLDGWFGECLGNLNVLPELAPCYVATDQALVLGWNAASLESALRSSPEPLDPDVSGGVLHLGRFPEADARLARAYGSEDTRRLRYPWRRAVVSGSAVGERFLIRVELTPGGDS